MSGHARADGMDTYDSVILGDNKEKKLDSSRQHEDDRTPITVGFAGDSNYGKTMLFSAFTGAKLKVVNWPGVTVEQVEGETSYKGRPIKAIDLLGIYSLTSYTIEERVARKCIEDDGVDVTINMVDVSSLERNLYPTTQFIEPKKPIILVLNMMDIVEERSMEMDMHRLPEMLGEVPAVPVSARKRTGLNMLMHTVIHHYEEGPQGVAIRYSQGVEEKIRLIKEALFKKYGEMDSMRWHAIRFLESDQVMIDDYPLDDMSRISPCDYEKQVINEKYDYIEKAIEECLFSKDEKTAITDRMDQFMIHPVWGIPMFLGIMALISFLMSIVGNFLKEYFQMGLGTFSGAALSPLTSVHAVQWIASLATDGIITGVGGILIFLPNIFILFLALTFLEDGGYMVRVAYVMNETMGMIGLSGKAFLFMLSGFGCTVPAVMAIRALKSMKDRRRAILIMPFTSCSARLPIYALLVEMSFPDRALIVVYSLHIIGLCMAILVAFIVYTHGKNDGVQNALLIELSKCRTPNGHTMATYIRDKVKDYLGETGTTVFIASIILWFVLSLGPKGFVSDVFDSLAAAINYVLVPVPKPAGLGQWQATAAFISDFSAKGVVVSGFSVLYGINDVNSTADMAALSSRLAMISSGGADAYALMIFCLLYSPCIAVVAAIKRETGSRRWTIRMVLFQLVVAWAGTMLVFQLGNLILQ